MDAYVRAGCQPQLGSSERFVDWSDPSAPTALPSVVTPAAVLTRVDPRELWASSVQVLAMAAMLLVSVFVGAIAGAAQAVGGPDVAAIQARGHVVALAEEMRAPRSVEEVARMRAETDHTLATVQSGLGPISVW